MRSDDKASKNHERYFVELGLYDFWLLATRIIKENFPPYIKIDKIEDAFNILRQFIAECGNTINVDLPDGYNSDNIIGIETEDRTMKLIWYTVDQAYKNIDEGDVLSEEMIEINQQIFGKNLELQFGFNFDYLFITPSYILIYGEEREIPEEIETKDELLKIDSIHDEMKIYDHQWGSYNQDPILQYRTRYYCDKGLIAVLWPKGATRSFHVENFFNY